MTHTIKITNVKTAKNLSTARCKHEKKTIDSFSGYSLDKVYVASNNWKISK
jgi:hypothetical protein